MTGLTAVTPRPRNWAGRQLDGAKLIYYGSAYKAEEKLTEIREKIHKPLAGLPTPTINIPFVLVPGWTTQPEAFAPLVQYLTRGGVNGGQPYYVKQGAIYVMGSDGQLQPATSVPANGKVFEMVFSDVHSSPDKQVVEMRQNFAAIQKATGAAQVDAEGYSMGGIDSRLYVDQGGTAIHRLLELGTPNQGTGFGSLAGNVVAENVGWAEKFAGVGPDDLDSLRWLTAGSPQITDLNSRWDEQRKKLPIITVGSDLLLTASPSGGFTWGDGLVPATSLEMPNSETIVLDDAMLHGRLNDDETVQHLRAIWFDWNLPASDKFPPDQEVADRVRAHLKACTKP